LPIVEAFGEWRVYLEGSELLMEVLTDYKNVVCFTTTEQLNRRQTRWAETLSIHNIHIVYQKWIENSKADTILKENDDKLVYNRPELPQFLDWRKITNKLD
jgi:hypothetical protein